MEDLKWVIFILIGIWIIWLVTGGARHPEATAGPFIKPPTPIDNGQIYGPKSAPRDNLNPNRPY